MKIQVYCDGSKRSLFSFFKLIFRERKGGERQVEREEREKEQEKH
jgi:hypothetical protein